jgi:hypothetical protein
LELPSVKDEGSVYAREGTSAHELAHRCWLVGTDADFFLGQNIEGFEVTPEMVSAVQLYLDTLSHAATQHPVRSEIRLTHPTIPDFGGTLDGLAEGEHPTIVDFKYGAGVAVEVERNSQLSCYALLGPT